MNWRWIIRAADGRMTAIERIVRRRTDDDCAALATLLLLDETPPAAAALVALPVMPLPVQAALAEAIEPALAAWRADPQWPGRAVSARARLRLVWGVAAAVRVLRAAPAALHNAVAVVLRSGVSDAVAHCIDALGVAGWRALADDQRAALLARADVEAIGGVWSALDEAQRAATAQRAALHPENAARLIASIAADDWQATAPTVRTFLIDAAAGDPWNIHYAAPAWAGMTSDERARLMTAIYEHNSWMPANMLIAELGVAGLAALPVDQRVALAVKARLEEIVTWPVSSVSSAAQWDALTEEERGAVLVSAQRAAARAARLLRVVGAARWETFPQNDRKRIAALIRRSPSALFACPPAVWADVAGDRLPPATEAGARAAHHWRAEDADADLGGLPPAHQALVFALAPWRAADAASDSVRMQRLRVAWESMTTDERVALATAHPSVLAVVAADARRRGAPAVVADVGETVARLAAATGGGEAPRSVGVTLRSPDHWRTWMTFFAPTDADPPETWEAWRRAARYGRIPAPEVCVRLAPHDCQNPPRRIIRTRP